MKRAIPCAVSLALMFILIQHSLLAQSAGARDAGCRQCHDCEIPTKLNPCLKECPRGQMVTMHHSADSGPVSVTLNGVTGDSDIYEPVRFAHKAHAKMAEMSGGCAQCHHYNLTGAVQACRTCHGASSPSKKADLSKPGLKGAYHRQCVNCHRESGLDTKCDGLCHHSKSATGIAVAVSRPKNAGSQVLRPDRLVFSSANPEVKTVTFFHSDHSDRFGLACSSCHTNEPCAKCHKGESAVVPATGHLDGGHDRCSTCHAVTENCQKCHDAKPQTKFNHAQRTRFDLGQFHSALACARCHKENSGFKGLSAACTSCHKGWKPGAFDHAATGIRLSENHIALDCESCHLDSNFAKKPECNTCHDDKSYPAALPGVRTQRTKIVKR